jgi:uncharacterized protein (DUF2267 family)
MDYGTFVGELTHELELPDTGRTVRAIRAVLTTLGQRISAGDASDVASNLPVGVRWYIDAGAGTHGERFDWARFLETVAAETQTDRAEAAYMARVIMAKVATVIPQADLMQLRNGLPEHSDAEDWGQLFELVDAN